MPQQPIKIYPLGAGTVRNVLQTLRRDFRGKGLMEYAEAKLPMLEAENPYATSNLMDRTEAYSENEAAGFEIGVVLAYEVVKERAGQDLPVLSETFIDVFEDMKHMRFVKLYGNNEDFIEEKADEEEEMKKGIFAMIEKDAYAVFQDEFMEPNFSFFTTSIFSGFVASHSLYAEGLSNPDFWE
jgi:hypothetical protein